jgi:predicted N-acetyltransferase YhbS
VVLRKGKPILTCNFDGDQHKDTIHLAAYDNEKVIGCLSLMKNKHDQFSEQNAFQLRGMAVLPAFQNKKIGHLLLSYALDELVKKKIELVWCNVRLMAVSFYKKHSFITIGTEYIIPEVGPHVLMYKSLNDA